MNKNLETMQQVYDAIDRGDIPFIIDCLADDVQWEEWADNTAQKSGVPWLQLRQGKEGAAEFFKLLSEMKVNEFKIISIMGSEDYVSAVAYIDLSIPELGTSFKDEEMHLWSFNKEGKITRMRHYVDTAKHMKAAGKDL